MPYSIKTSSVLSVEVTLHLTAVATSSGKKMHEKWHWQLVGCRTRRLYGLRFAESITSTFFAFRWACVWVCALFNHFRRPLLNGSAGIFVYIKWVCFWPMLHICRHVLRFAGRKTIHSIDLFVSGHCQQGNNRAHMQFAIVVEFKRTFSPFWGRWGDWIGQFHFLCFCSADSYVVSSLFFVLRRAIVIVCSQTRHRLFIYTASITWKYTHMPEAYRSQLFH